MSNNPFEDSYPASGCIIPPRSIVNGTAPLGAFLTYIGTVDMSKVRLCDAIRLYNWLSQYMDAMPEAIRKHYEEALAKELE